MNLVFIPYGNAREVFNSSSKLWEIECQHGESECWGNSLHGCFIYQYPRVEDHFPFVYCMESAKSNRNEDIHTLANLCAKKLKMPIDQVLKCVDSPLGMI